MRHPGYCTKCGAEMNPHASGLCKPHRQEAYDNAQRAARRGRRRTRSYGEREDYAATFAIGDYEINGPNGY